MYSVTKRIPLQISSAHYVSVTKPMYVLWHSTFCDVHILTILCFICLLCVQLREVTYTSCNVYVVCSNTLTVVHSLSYWIYVQYRTSIEETSSTSTVTHTQQHFKTSIPPPPFHHNCNIKNQSQIMGLGFCLRRQTFATVSDKWQPLVRRCVLFYSGKISLPRTTATGVISGKWRGKDDAPKNRQNVK